MVIVARQFISRIRGDTAPRQRHSQSRKPHRFRKKVADSGLNMEGKRGGFQSDRKKYRRFTWKRESRGFPASLPHDHHDGLAFQFSEPTAEKALAACHHEVFEQLLECPLEDFVCQLEVTCVAPTPTPVRPRMSGRSCKRTGPPYPCAVARWRRGCLFPMSRSL